MMKEKYEAYKLGSKVYALSLYHADGKATDHCAIYPAVVKDVTFAIEGINIKIAYWLTTPEGKEWGDSNESEYVSDNFDELVDKMKKIWNNNANDF